VKKRVSILLIVLSIFLTACGGAESSNEGDKEPATSGNVEQPVTQQDDKSEGAVGIVKPEATQEPVKSCFDGSVPRGLYTGYSPYYRAWQPFYAEMNEKEVIAYYLDEQYVFTEEHLVTGETYYKHKDTVILRRDDAELYIYPYVSEYTQEGIQVYTFELVIGDKSYIVVSDGKATELNHFPLEDYQDLDAMGEWGAISVTEEIKSLLLEPVKEDYMVSYSLEESYGAGQYQKYQYSYFNDCGNVSYGGGTLYVFEEEAAAAKFVEGRANDGYVQHGKMVKYTSDSVNREIYSDFYKEIFISEKKCYDNKEKKCLVYYSKPFSEEYLKSLNEVAKCFEINQGRYTESGESSDKHGVIIYPGSYDFDITIELENLPQKDVKVMQNGEGFYAKFYSYHYDTNYLLDFQFADNTLTLTVKEYNGGEVTFDRIFELNCSKEYTWTGKKVQ